MPFIVRSLATGTAMKLFVHLRIPPEAFQGLLKNIKYVNIVCKMYFMLVTVAIYRGHTCNQGEGGEHRVHPHPHPHPPPPTPPKRLNFPPQNF